MVPVARTPKAVGGSDSARGEGEVAERKAKRQQNEDEEAAAPGEHKRRRVKAVYESRR